MAEGGGLLNRYTVNPVSWVRIPSPPPPKYLILQGFPSKMPGFEIPRHVRGFAGDADRHTLWRDRFGRLRSAKPAHCLSWPMM